MAAFENVPEMTFSSLQRDDKDEDGFGTIKNSKFKTVKHFEEAVMGRARELL